MQQTPFLDGTQPVQVLNEAKLKEMMQDVGLVDCKFYNLLNGVVAIHIGNND